MTTFDLDIEVVDIDTALDAVDNSTTEHLTISQLLKEF